MPNPTYTSRLSLPYARHTLTTLDIHTRTSPSPLPQTYNLIFIHGGAFRDPLDTSTSLLPALPALFRNRNIAHIASVNYRLSPYPSHPTHPSSEEEEERNVIWPRHIEDVREAVEWLGCGMGGEGWRGREWLLVGHSVGATMAMMLTLRDDTDGKAEGMWGIETAPLVGLKGVVCIAGIYNFAACRDAHEESRAFYEGFILGAFGPEGEGGWERGNVKREVEGGRGLRDGVEVVIVGLSDGDEAVEMEQGWGILEALSKREGEGKVRAVILLGNHEELVSGGVGVARCVDEAFHQLVKA